MASQMRLFIFSAKNKNWNYALLADKYLMCKLL